MTANFVDQFGFNDEEFSEHDENIKWVSFSDPVISAEIRFRVLQRLALMYCFDKFCGEDCHWNVLFKSCSAAFDRIAEINFNIDADDHSVSAWHWKHHSLFKLSLNSAVSVCFDALLFFLYFCAPVGQCSSFWGVL